MLPRHQNREVAIGTNPIYPAQQSISSPKGKAGDATWLVDFSVERQPTRRTFDDYYKELLVYFEREGHIDIPQSYINPSTGCKLGLYLTRLLQH